MTSPDQEVQGTKSEMRIREHIEGCAAAFTGTECSCPPEVVWVPREVAERLAEALAVISADTDPPDGAEDSASGLAWRVKLAHETEREFRAVFPEVVESAGHSLGDQRIGPKAEEA